MKTLDQIEPRRPISALPFTISQPGSYYLTRSLGFNSDSGDAITIAVNDVTLDLMGFTLSSTSGVSGNAITIDSGLRNIAVSNGVIAGNTTVTISGTAPNRTWTVNAAGFAYGIKSLGTVARNCHLYQLRISGCRTSGLDGGAEVLVEQVTAAQNGQFGIVATSGSITNSGAGFNGGNSFREGIFLASSGNVTNCTAYSNAGFGITASSGKVANSVANSDGSSGIAAPDGRVINSMANRNQSIGISAPGGSVINCTASFNEGQGIHAAGGTVTSSIARSNGDNGIDVSSGVVAFCKSAGNNQNNGSGVDIDAPGSTRSGNHPTP